VRIVVYDRTCVHKPNPLTYAWRSGTWLYRALGRVDRVRGVASWDEALAWLAALDEPIDELQYWGHGKWGTALVDRDVIDERAFAVAGHRHRAALEAIRERMHGRNALVWFRTCETFGARRGLAFAERVADFFGARVAGHTYVIGFHQSGLHGLAPGMRATWSEREGLVEGTPEAPERAAWSRRREPNTITCLHGQVPVSWFAQR
jgi:hypothetical protein